MDIRLDAGVHGVALWTVTQPPTIRPNPLPAEQVIEKKKYSVSMHLELTDNYVLCTTRLVERTSLDAEL